MRNDFVDKEMRHLDADGVDFVPIVCHEILPAVIYSSYTKEQWATEHCVPKTGRKYWKRLPDGCKQYIDTET